MPKKRRVRPAPILIRGYLDALDNDGRMHWFTGSTRLCDGQFGEPIDRTDGQAYVRCEDCKALYILDMTSSQYRLQYDDGSTEREA